MRSFLKMFLASLLAIFAFFGLIFLLFSVIAGALVSGKSEKVEPGSVLYIDLSKTYSEKRMSNPILLLTGNESDEIPTLYEMTRLIRRAAKDTAIRGIYIKSANNGNGWAASEELRNAMSDFRASGKFVIAYGEYISQKAYHVANVADKVFLHPKGSFEWEGLSVEYVFFKNLLQKLEIEPQIFYDGKFKSATEPFRSDRMTDANRLQTSVWLGDIYANFISCAARSRKLDSAKLCQLANVYGLPKAEDALNNKLVDGLKYDDEVKDEIKKRLKLNEDDKITFLTPGAYLNAKSLKEFGKDKIAVIYAEGDIVDGKGESGEIGSDEYRNLIRKVRNMKEVKAIVLRVNSPGGSSLASEVIWRELSLARKMGKPVVVSMGDVAASGGYYISCMADSIFVQPNTITGSIGVFAIVPNMEGFFRNKLGITFDGVKTGEFAGGLSISKPMSSQEKAIVQAQVDQIYADFKGRVADGRKMNVSQVDSIAQGRVWTGQRAVQIGLADRVGSVDQAIRAAASLAKLKEYNVSEYPETKSPFDELFESYVNNAQTRSLESELGAENLRLLREMKRIRSQFGIVQARLPFIVQH